MTHAAAPTAPPANVLLQTMMSAWVSQAVGTLARLRVCDQLAAGPASAEEVAGRLHLDADALLRLMRACVSAGVLEALPTRRFGLTAAGQLLRSDVPGSMRALVDAESAPGHWLPWGRLDECLRTGRSSVPAALGSDVWTYYARHPEEGRAFAEGMSGFSAMAIHAIDAVFQAPPARTIVDVGGAHGAFLSYLLGKLPAARGILYDLPHVIESAGRALAGNPAAPRIERVAGDFLQSVPPGGDLYLLKHIVHDWDDEKATVILSNVRKALAPGGTVLTVEMLLPEDGTPSPAVLLDLNMLVMLSGRERTRPEMSTLFAAAGLELYDVTPTPSPFYLLHARAR